MMNNLNSVLSSKGERGFLSNPILLEQEAGAIALRLVPQSPTIDPHGTRFYFEIQQTQNNVSWKDPNPIMIRFSKDVPSKIWIVEDYPKHGHYEESISTIQDAHQEFKDIFEALDYLNRFFKADFYLERNTKMLRSGVTFEEILKLESGTVRIIENEMLEFIAKNPYVTKKDLLFKFGASRAEYVERWGHDYGNNKTPLIEWSDTSNGWIITNDGLAFICNKEATY